MQGVRVNFQLPRKSELFESYRFFAGNPARVAGTGVFATFFDGIATTLGFMPRNASHFVLDPFPTQVRDSRSWLPSVPLRLRHVVSRVCRRRCALSLAPTTSTTSSAVCRATTC
jgi:hypothetical protein